MSDFNYNNNGDNGNKPPMQKSAIIVTVVVLGAIVVIFFGIRSSNIPLIMGGFFLAFITMFVAAALQGKNKGAGGAKSGISGAKVNTTQLNKYMPLLADERTKQHPEVQRLLQYPAVQKAFFDPSSLSSSTIANDPHVGELFLVFDEMLAQGVINGTVYGTQGNVTPMATPMQSAMPTQPKPVNTSRRKIGLILDIVGSSMFVLPFISVFFVTTHLDSPMAVSMMSFVVSSAMPLGIILIVVGTIMRRR